MNKVHARLQGDAAAVAARTLLEPLLCGRRQEDRIIGQRVADLVVGRCADQVRRDEAGAEGVQADDLERRALAGDRGIEFKHRRGQRHAVALRQHGIHVFVEKRLGAADLHIGHAGQSLDRRRKLVERRRINQMDRKPQRNPYRNCRDGDQCPHRMRAPFAQQQPARELAQRCGGRRSGHGQEHSSASMSVARLMGLMRSSSRCCLAARFRRSFSRTAACAFRCARWAAAAGSGAGAQGRASSEAPVVAAGQGVRRWLALRSTGHGEMVGAAAGMATAVASVGLDFTGFSPGS